MPVVVSVVDHSPLISAEAKLSTVSCDTATVKAMKAGLGGMLGALVNEKLVSTLLVGKAVDLRGSDGRIRYTIRVESVTFEK